MEKVNVYKILLQNNYIDWACVDTWAVRQGEVYTRAETPAITVQWNVTAKN